MAKPKDQESEAESTTGEITFLDLVAVLWLHKFLIIGITFAFAVYAVVYSVISLMLPPEESYLPNHFTVDADMLIKSSGSGSSLSSMLGSSASALAGLAGISLSSGGGNSDLALYLVSSRDFLDAVIEEFNLYEKFDFDPEKVKSPRSTAREIVSKMMSASYDEETGIFTVSSTNTDPQLAFDIVNFTVDYLEQKFLALGVDENLLTKKNLEENIDACVKEIAHLQQQTGEVERSVSNMYGPGSAEPISMKLSMIEIELSAQEEIYKQLKVQYELLKIDMASETPVFQILSRPEIPDRKSGPSRGKLCIIVTFVGGCLSVLLSFAIEALGNLKNDEAVASKFKRRDGRGFSLFRRGRKAAPTIRLVRAHAESPDEDDAGGDVPKVSSQPSREPAQSTDADEDGAEDDDDDDEDEAPDYDDDTEQDEDDELEAEDDRSLEDEADDDVDEGDSAGDESQEGTGGGESQDDLDEAANNESQGDVRDDEKPRLPAQKALSARVSSGTGSQPKEAATRSPDSAPAKPTLQLQRPTRLALPPDAPRATKPPVRPTSEGVQPKGSLSHAEGEAARRMRLKPNVPEVQRAVVRSETPKGEKADETKKRGKKDDKRDDKKGDKKRGKKDRD